MSENITSITFRMYNTGSVGDCLLLLFKKGQTISFKMLIDCGGWNTNSVAVTPCVEDINTICNGELDLLVVTHQHEDHISGFNQARAEFDKIKVKEVWMSWIEDKSDDIAKILKDKYGKKLKQLKRITEQAIRELKGKGVSNVKGFGARMQAKKMTMEQTMELIQFEEGKTYGKRLAAGKSTNDDAMEYVRSKGKKMRYWRPGEVINDIAGAEGMKFFILGPPRDTDMKYFKIDLEEDEMYKIKKLQEESPEEILPQDSIFKNDIGLEEGVSPFADNYKMDRVEAARFNREYNSKEMKWRQIETDWLESGAAIALRVNRLTNNTSLAMAIEFASGKVVLLPGDAQSGNWMGWHKKDVMDSLKAKGGKNTDELLKDTIFYKVGHHGSHNGTASKSGLDFISNKDLVAAMPLVQDKIPTAWGGSKNFPAKALYDVLIDKTKGRIIRTDEGVITKVSAKKMRDQLSSAQKKAFKDSFSKGKCWVEYRIDGTG